MSIATMTIDSTNLLQRQIELQERLRKETEDRYRRDIAAIDETIRMLRHQIRRPHSNESASEKLAIRPGQWRGMKPAAALQACLLMFEKQSTRLDDCLELLLLAGVDLGEKGREKRNLKIMISSNPKTFRYHKADDTVELIDKNAV